MCTCRLIGLPLDLLQSLEEDKLLRENSIKARTGVNKRRMDVETLRLILLDTVNNLIRGQTGKTQGDEPHGMTFKWTRFVSTCQNSTLQYDSVVIIINIINRSCAAG